MSLPKSKDSLGYTRQEILDIIKPLGIHHKKFWKAFGVNTVGVAEDGTSRYYQCDVERALWSLGAKDGKFHLWD